MRRRLSTARTWSQTATEFVPAEGAATTIGGRGCGPVDRGTTTTVRRDIRRVVTAAEIAARLGPKDDGIRVLLLGHGADVLELTVAYVTLPERRPGHVPAAWVTTASPPEATSRRSGQLRLVRPLPKAVAESIREMEA